MRIPSPRPRKNTGSAVIAALLVVALVAALLLIIQVVHHASIMRTTDVIAYEKAYTFALGVEEWAIGRLSDYQNLPLEKRAKQTWPIVLEKRLDEGNQISGEIIDQQSQLNINSLNNPAQQNQLGTLLQKVIPNEADAQPFMNAIMQLPAANSNQDTSPRAMTFPSELRAINGVSPQILQKLYPYLTALPTTTQRTNINTASTQILMSLDPNITDSMVQAIQTARESKGGFTAVADAMTLLTPPGGKAPSVTIDIVSTYFLVHAHVQRGEINLDLYSMLSVQTQDKQVEVKVLWRTPVYP